MATAYDPATSYKGDGQFATFTESCTWVKPDGTKLTGLKARLEDSNTPDIVSVAAGIGLTSIAAAFVVWQPNLSDDSEPATAFEPAAGDILRRESDGDEGWLIKGVGESRFGHWLCLCDREAVNAE